MADYHEFDDFDSILKSIDSAADGAANDVNLDELLAQLSVEFPADFGDKAPSKPAEDAPADAPKKAKKARKEPKKPRAAKQQEEARSSQQEEAPSPQQEPQDSPDLPQKTGGFLDTVSRHHKGINLALAIIALVLVAGIVAVVLWQTNADPYQNKIVSNVRVAGVDVGGMTRQEAAEAVSTAVGSSYTSTDMTVVLGKEELILAASQTRPKLNIAQAIELAYAYARTGSTTQRQQEYQAAQQAPVDIPLGGSLELDSDYIRSTVSNFLSSISAQYVPSGYTLEGARPGLDADSYDASVPCQNLVLTVGTPGSDYDLAGILTSIAEAYSQRNFRDVVPDQYLPQEPEALDIDAIYNEVHVDAVEAVGGSDSSEGTPGSCGYTFSLEDARQQLSNASYGDVITIPMEYIVPEKLDSNGIFQYPLGSFTTPVSSNEAYNQNMKLLCQQLNGLVLEAGQSFSFNTVLKDRTEANGFQLAPTHGDQCIEEEVAGGSDQVATTLYVAAMTSGMQLTERHNASHVCPYTTIGTELSVSGWKNLQFRNSLDGSVMIRAKVTDSRVIIRFLSEKEVDFEVKLEVNQLSTIQPKNVTVRKNVADGYQGQQVLTEGIEGGQISINWVTYKKGTDTVIKKTGEYVTLPALDHAVVELYA